MVFIADLQKHLSGGVFLQELTPAQVFSYEFCEIFWNIYFEEHLLTSASGLSRACSFFFLIDLSILRIYSELP